MTLDDVGLRARDFGLDVFGALHPCSDDGLPSDIQTLVLLGPSEPGFWDHITSQPEFADGAPDAIDRWSRRVIGGLACDLGGKAYFPFTGPPWRPFIDWAKRSGRAWASEVGILVHDTAGLMVSYRGALGLRDRLALPKPGLRPCESCSAKPCLSACPAVALTSDGYDVAACRDYLATPEGSDCLDSGCRVRRACPVSQSYGRRPEQSSYHMRHFAR
ncbi:MAG: ferredoxin [Pseudomonadota bacterium]